MEASHMKKPWIETPLVWSRSLSKAAGCQIYLKLENTQPSGSFKSRGMGAFVEAHLAKNSDSAKTTHFFCSSGGNAGLGCVHAAITLGCPATIVVPLSTSEYMISKIRDAGATEVIQKGASWYEANEYLNSEVIVKARARGENAVYVPPFDDPEIWAGHSTIVDEIVTQLPRMDLHYPRAVAPSTTNGQPAASHTEPSDQQAAELPDAIVCSVGGGGLLNGVVQGIQRHQPRSQTRTKVVAVETVGADSLAQAVQQGMLITLPKITSIATTLGARTVSKQTFEYAMDKELVKTVVLPDADAVDGCKRFADDERILVEPACGVSLAACYNGKLRQLLPGLRSDSRVVVIVCGGSGASLEILSQYVKDFAN